MMKVKYSQSVRALAEGLVEECFSEGVSVFTKVFVAVPDMRMKGFLSQYLLEQLGVCAGLTILPLQQLIVEMQECSGEVFANKPLPTLGELSLCIQQELLAGEVRELQPYLERLGCSQKKIAKFADETAALFLDYALYGKEPAGWQGVLWKRVFVHFSEQLDLQFELDAKVYLFGFSDLEEVYLRFFSRFETSCYFFSPCALFWEDALSRSEKRWWIRKAKRVGASDDVFHEEEMNPLLANWGSMGRQFTKRLGNFEVDEEERYVSCETDSLLSKVQRAVLLGEEEHFEADDSIQIHSAPSKLEEVEAVYREMGTLVQDVAPHEILVVVNNLAEYAPLIRTVFEQIPFQMRDCQVEQEEPLVRLILLGRQGFCVDEVISLMQEGCWQKRWGVDREGVAALVKFFRAAHVESDSVKGHTFQDGIDRLICGLVHADFPVDVIAHAEIECLGSFVAFWEKVRADSKRLEGKRCVREWVELFLEMAETHFAFSEEEMGFARELEKLKGRSYLREEPLFSLDGALCFLRRAFAGKAGGAGIDRVVISGIDEGHLPSARVIFCMGVDEESLPSAGFKVQVEGAPSVADRERYVLLEALMKAQERLYFTYERFDPKDAKQKGVSLLLSDLMDFVGDVKRVDHERVASGLEVGGASFFCGSKEKIEEKEVSILQLKKCAKSAVQLYFNETLGVQLSYLEDEKERHFTLSALDKALFRREVGVRGMEGVIERRVRGGELPYGQFAKLAMRELKEEAEGLKRVEEVQLVKGLRVGNGVRRAVEVGEWTVVGKLEGVTDEGLVVDGYGNLKGMMRALPVWLVYERLYPKTCGGILFARDQKRIDGLRGDLEQFLQFYEMARKDCCPLTSDNLKFFMENDRSGFEKSLEKETDPYVQLLARRGVLGELGSKFDVWQERVATVFEGVFELC